MKRNSRFLHPLRLKSMILIVLIDFYFSKRENLTKFKIDLY